MSTKERTKKRTKKRKMVTEKEHQKVINKIKLMISLNAGGEEWNKMSKYLDYKYSCHHCFYLETSAGEKPCSSPEYLERGWCLLWMERKNWLNIKMEEKNEEK